MKIFPNRMRLLSLGIMIFLLSTNSYALRCKGKIIFAGDTITQVETSCGEPQSKREWTVQTCYNQNISDVNNSNCILINTIMNEWIYKASTGSSYDVLLFENQILKSIKFDR